MVALAGGDRIRTRSNTGLRKESMGSKDGPDVSGDEKERGGDGGDGGGLMLSCLVINCHP